MVVGSGGREHALVEALAASPQEPEMYAAPGNPGIARIAQIADIPADDLISLRDYARERDIDLTVVGPESPLIGGIAECFWEENLKIFGPSRAAARIEGSKIFAKELMHHAGVPTARSEAFDGEAAALAYLRRLNDYPIVIKADGAAAGKGVTVARSREEAENAVRAAFAGRFGAAGERIVIEEYLEGREASVFVITDGQEMLPRLGTDLLELMIAAEMGDIAGREVTWSADKAVCVVLASDGYPETSSSGDGISGLENIPTGVYIYHAGTEERDGRFYTAGGRVLNVVGTGPTIIEARARAYAAVEQIHFEGMHYRTDIALEAIELEDI